MLEKSNQDLIRLTKLSQESMDGLRAANWDLTESVFNSYTQESCIVLDIFRKVLGFDKDVKGNGVNFNEVKNRMSAFQASDIQESDIDDLFLIYNSKETFKHQKTAELLVDWMSFALECKLYRKKILELKNIQPKLIEKIQKKLERIYKYSKIKQDLERNLNDLRKYLQCNKLDYSSSRETRSKKSQSISNSESKTVLKIEDYSVIHVSTDDCYKEQTQIKSFQRIPPLIESDQELKCCRMKYFCF